MKEENSAGGVVFYQDKVLVLKKKRGYWVLPKGRIEQNEGQEAAALREVLEEAGVNADILGYVGDIRYSYRNQWTDYQQIAKRVVWYLMETSDCCCRPQVEEGFSGARFVQGDEAVRMLRYDDERRILIKALDLRRGGLVENRAE